LSDRKFAGRMPELPAVDRLSGAFHHACAIQRGTVTCWGLNGAGQLGRGTIDDDDACLAGDMRKCGKTPAVVPGFDAVEISSGADFNVALRADGTVWAWGSNQSGKCGQPPGSDAGLSVCGGGNPCLPTPRRIAGVGR
jgi:alpha-tubulin suppressor-like RCC1 family protein